MDAKLQRLFIGNAGAKLFPNAGHFAVKRIADFLGGNFGIANRGDNLAAAGVAVIRRSPA